MSPRAPRSVIERTVTTEAMPFGFQPTRRGFDWRSLVIRHLVAAPGIWHRVENAPIVSSRFIMDGPSVRSNPWLPLGSFEAVREDGALYVRYLGTALAPLVPDLGDLRELRHVWRLVPAPEEWRSYSSPERVLASPLSTRPPRMDPSSPPPDATTAERCAYCTWRPARGFIRGEGMNGGMNGTPSCGVTAGHPQGFEPYDPLPSSQVHGEPEGPAPDPVTYVEPVDPPSREQSIRIDATDLAWSDVRKVIDQAPGRWFAIEGKRPDYSTRINRGRIPALAGVEARSRDGLLELRLPLEGDR